MSRSWIKIALVSLSLTAAVPAFAFAGERGASAERVKGEKGEKDHAKNFPMKAETFIGKVNERITKMRDRVEKRLDKKGVAEDKQKEIMATFDANAQKVRDAAKTAGEDGTVTLEEAKGVRKLAKELRGEHGKGKAKKGEGKKGKGKGKEKGKADA